MKRITDVLRSISDPSLRQRVQRYTRERSRSLRSQLGDPESRVTIQTVDTGYPMDPRKVLRHTMLFVGLRPALVIHTVVVPR